MTSRERRMLEAARDQALEDAAKELERIYDHGLVGAHMGELTNRAARAIRALKGEGEKP